VSTPQKKGGGSGNLDFRQGGKLSPAISRLPRVVYGGDRQIAVNVLRFLHEQQLRPLGLLLPEQGRGSHTEQLLSLCPHLDASRIWYGKYFSDPTVLDTLGSLEIDYIFCIHLSTFIPKNVLEIPKHGVLNLHPAYLPYNRGWHSAVWSILEGTPFGATLHFMSDRLDEGDIVHQKSLGKRPNDTGDSLYKRAMELEFEVFREAWPALASFSYTRTPQRHDLATRHKIKDLAASGVQELDPNSTMSVRDVLDRLRALTTNRPDEASFFMDKGCKYRIQVSITEVAE
jgi:methionyl-tRNA formyltransferase